MSKPCVRFFHSPVLHVCVGAVLIVAAFLLSCRVLVPRSQTFQRAVSFLRGQPGPTTHPAGQLRAGAPITDRQENAPAPSIR